VQPSTPAKFRTDLASRTRYSSSRDRKSCCYNSSPPASTTSTTNHILHVNKRYRRLFYSSCSSYWRRSSNHNIISTLLHGKCGYLHLRWFGVYVCLKFAGGILTVVEVYAIWNALSFIVAPTRVPENWNSPHPRDVLKSLYLIPPCAKKLLSSSNNSRNNIDKAIVSQSCF